MHAIHLAEMAAVFAQNATVQLKLGSFPDRELSNSYWLATRFRHDEWSGRLARHRIEIQRPGASHRLQCWNTINPLLQEILLAEPLARVIAYFGKLAESVASKGNHLAAYSGEFTSLSETAFQSHTEARNRCLHLIVFGQGLPADQAASLNRLRQQLEIYCDQLLAFLPFDHSVETFAFNPIDVAQVHETIHSDGAADENRRWHLIKLRQQLWLNHERHIDRRASSARLNNRLSNVVLKAFSPAMFDGFGIPISAELARVKNGQSKDITQAASNDESIKKLFAPQGVRSGEPAAAKRF